MTNQLSHFAIHADDLDRARKFYAGIFGWTFHWRWVSLRQGTASAVPIELAKEGGFSR